MIALTTTTTCTRPAQWHKLLEFFWSLRQSKRQQSFDSTWDRNSNTTTGYHAWTSQGRDRAISRRNVSQKVRPYLGACSNGNYNGTWPNQALEPIYEWADAYSPVPNNQSDIWSTNYGPMTQNQDYYLGTTNSGNPISFNGTSGVGAGLLSARPSTCTSLVAYWATDHKHAVPVLEHKYLDGLLPAVHLSTPAHTGFFGKP